MEELRNIVTIGPVYPYKGGISHYTGLLVQNLRKKYNTEMISYKMQYPKLLFRKEQKDYGNKTFAVEDTKYWIHTANPFNCLAVAEKIKKQNPDLIIVEWWHPYFAPCYQILLGALRKYKILFTCHNVLPHERFFMDAYLVKNTLKRGSFCIVHSKEDEENLLKLLPNMKCKRTVHPTYNAFKIENMSRENAREKLRIQKEEKVLLFFGLVRKYKGLSYLLEAMPDIQKRISDVKLYIVGDFGKNREEYEQIIKEKGIGNAVVIKDGYVPDKEVEPYFAAADLNICPYESATQSGIVQIAYGFGLPVVVTNVGGLPEVVDDGETGYVVEPQNPAAIADAVCRYFTEEREDEFRKNVERQAERFSWDRMVEIIEELWSEKA